MPNQRSEATANVFLFFAGERGLKQVQLQNLVCMAHGWALACCGKPLTATEPEAWRRGPVYRELRDKVIYAGSKPITKRIHENDANPFAILAYEDRGHEIVGDFSATEQQIMNLVWGRYGHLHGFTLSDLTRQPGTPWYSTYHCRGKNTAISNNEIEAYYSKLARKLEAKSCGGISG